MLTIWIISLLYLVIDFFFKRKNRMALWGLMNAFIGLIFIITSLIYIGKFVHYYWYPYFFILIWSLIIINTLRLLRFLFFPFLFWRKKDLSLETFTEWPLIFKGKRLPYYKMYNFSHKLTCLNYPHPRFEKIFQFMYKIASKVKTGDDFMSKINGDPNWVFEEPSPSFNRVFVYVSGHIYVICTKCKSQIQKLECKTGTMEPLDKYDIYDERDPFLNNG